MKTQITEQLTEFNQIIKEMDGIYHNYAKTHNLSDTAFWVMYSIWGHEESYSQRELCEDWFYPPQTVNSALKILEKQGLIELVFTQGNRKSKDVRFTPAGKALAKKVIEPLMLAEHNSFSGLDEQERCTLLSISQKHIALLKNEVCSKLEL